MENNIILNKLYVKGLFGTFDYNIVRQQDSNLIILTGPNGFGKSTLLHSIVSVFQYSLSYFLTFPFKVMRFEMTKGEKKIFLEMHQTQSRQQNVEGDILLANNVESLSILLDVDGERSEQTRTMLEVESMLGDFGYSKYLDEWKKGDYRYSLAQVYENEYMLEGMLFDQIQIADVISEEHVVYKKDDRKEDYGNTLSKMKDLMSGSRERFSKVVTDNFAELIQAGYIGLDSSEKELPKLKNIVQRIKKYNLCSVDLTAIPNVETVFGVLGPQIDELEKEIIIPLQQYEKAIADKQFENKHMVIDNEGIRFNTNDGDELIDTGSLSSGEKQVVALYYDLFFEKSVSMIIIDEPETSWHVSWQVDFLEEMKELASFKDCQVFVATHSPYIINKCSNLVTDLYEQSKR